MTHFLKRENCHSKRKLGRKPRILRGEEKSHEGKTSQHVSKNILCPILCQEILGKEEGIPQPSRVPCCPLGSTRRSWFIKVLRNHSKGLVSSCDSVFQTPWPPSFYFHWWSVYSYGMSRSPLCLGNLVVNAWGQMFWKHTGLIWPWLFLSEP